ncbi:MAG: hypothetical protein PWQ67_2027 [Clostridia bacterium]|jgi:hypothetical protein|nr:hypothetical protein [Clostridia bacterium]MDN5323573.1 hypothetical protein [Clostridia bacterium]
MAIKIYTENFPDKLIDKLKSLNIITNKDEIIAIYVNTFLGNIRDTNILTTEKLINWVAKINKSEKNIINLKKLKDITYIEKGLYGTITYHLSAKKTFSLKLNRQDGDKFYKLSLETWQKLKNSN